MRFPWLQVDADFIAAHAGDLGAHLGISRREAIGLAIDLWTWALARAPDDAPPDGMVTGAGPVPDRLLSGSVGWTGPVEQFTGALLACGLAVQVESGYRLTGFERYKATWEKNRRRTGGKPERNRTGTGEEPARKTQTQTYIETTTLSESADPKETPSDMRALWNAEADPRLPRWRELPPKRAQQAAARLRERPLAEWRIILGRINGSPFCLGQNDRGWKADVEFFLRPDTATRVLEGKYDPKPGAGLPKPPDIHGEGWVTT